jgi:hypothetical protein
MKKFFLAVLLIVLPLFLSLPAVAQNGGAIQIGAQMTASVATTGNGIATPTTYYHQLSWTLSGPAPTACTVELDTAPDDSTWTTGGAIPAQTCTSGGQSALFNSASADVRINLATFTGTGTIHISCVGYSSGPAGVVMSGAAAPTGTCTSGALYTITGTGVLYSCNNGTWATVGGALAFPLTVTGGTSGGIPYFSSTTSLASSALLTTAHLMLGGGAGAAPLVDAGCSTNEVGSLTCGAINGTTHGSSAGHVFFSSTAPSVAAAGCGGSGASITSNNGTAAFKINVGTSNTGTCTITLPTAGTDWVCFADDITTTSTSVFITKIVPTSGHLTTEVTLQNYTDAAATGDWTDSDILEVSCHGE